MVDAGHEVLVPGQARKQVHFTAQGGRKIGMEPEIPGGNTRRTPRVKLDQEIHVARDRVEIGPASGMPKTSRRITP